MTANIFRRASMLFAAVAAFLIVSCSSTKTVQAQELPGTASAFISQYFSGKQIVHVEKDRENLFKVEYKVHLNDGTELEFDGKGNWLEVDGPDEKAIPTGFFPKPIVDYIANKFPGIQVSKITKDRREFEVELANGMDLEFDNKGNFLRVD